jgi:ribosome biogenesis GTPase
MSDSERLSGQVVKAQSGFFWVETERGLIRTQIPGRLKQERKGTDIVAVGDYVELDTPDGEHGMIAHVAPRVRVLSRARPAANARQVRHDREQVLVANVDQVVFVLAVKNPQPSLRKLDRFLVVAEQHGIPAIICVNKIDLVPPGSAVAMFDLYARLGYAVIYTSAQRGEGVAALRALLAGKLTVFAGSSGVGKSSLLNAVQPDLGLRVRAVSAATGKGMHTTRFAELIPLDGGGYVADTPGIRGLAIYDVEPAEIDGYFREIAPLVADCRFNDCTHRQETGCAVRRAVEEGSISPARYDSYLRLREEHQLLDDEAFG